MKICYLVLGCVFICFLGCKKKNTSVIFKGDGFIYTSGNPEVVAGSVGWYFAESRLGQWKMLPLIESQLPNEYKNISVADSIAVTVSLDKTKTPVSCDCTPGVFYYYNIISISKR